MDKYMNTEEIAKKIEETLVKYEVPEKITQKTLAKQIGISEQLLSKILTRKAQRITWGTFMKVNRWANRQEKRLLLEEVKNL